MCIIVSTYYTYPHWNNVQFLSNTQWQQNQFHIHCMLIKHQVRVLPKWYYFHFQFILFNIVFWVYCHILFYFVISSHTHKYYICNRKCINICTTDVRKRIWTHIFGLAWCCCYNVWMNNLGAMHCMQIYVCSTYTYINVNS